MAKTGHFLHNSAHAVNLPATTAYSTTPVQYHDITNLGTAGGGILNRSYYLRTLYIKLDTLAVAPNTPTTLTVRLTRDIAGNDTVVGDTTASISYGITTATEGAVTIAIDFVYSHNSVGGALPDNNLYLFWKVDKGTAQVRRIELTTEE
jgi:hypothetical protein